ncbi:DUF1684 domain-containing protein [Rhizobium sp. P40RR-XXII]|uniref:DUF1684 domain-containing protein n=1 Tax=Rhizobium sp. P40RR-XXII TaxID=2726739 RepID=UPI0014566067|nr:DUF1684 domain-containing protein [Rhizobium sp. P40RR-XXII]NLS18600.1 DUF1684 domain-containing protein [Rhizobium sp. P40RR-XXII]
MGESDLSETQQLWEWREKIADLYYVVRSSQDVVAAWGLWCDTRSTLFRDHPQSPIEPADRKTFEGPAIFPYDPSLRLAVQLIPVTPERITVATGADGDLSMHAFARTTGLEARLGGELTLYWIEGYGGGVFLPFADATSGTETYGGGRYLLDTIKGADLGVVRPDGTLVLDFNFSYFPSCAYSSRYVCPLAPSGNRLNGAVKAGERLPISK